MDRRRPLMAARPSMQPTALVWRQTPAGNFLWHRQNTYDDGKKRILGFGAGWCISYGLVLIALFTAAAVLIGLGLSSNTQGNDNSADLASLTSPPPATAAAPPPPPPGATTTGGGGTTTGGGGTTTGGGGTTTGGGGTTTGGGGTTTGGGGSTTSGSTTTGGSTTGGGGSGTGSTTSVSQFSAGDSTAGGIGDPHFIGFDGTPFDFHGHSGGYFNLLSEELLQINSQFDDQQQGAGWTFMRSIGIKYRPGNTRIAIELAAPGKMRVTVNGRVLQPIYGTMRMQLGEGAWLRYTARADGHSVNTVNGNADKKDRDALFFESPHFAFTFYILPNQLHINMESELRTFTRGLDVHGVLGQTYSWVLADESGTAPLRRPEGDDGDYEVSGLFEDDFLYNRYNAVGEGGVDVLEENAGGVGVKRVLGQLGRGISGISRRSSRLLLSQHLL